MSEKNIFQRINAVMQEVAYVQKDKAVTGMGAGYKAVTHDNLVSVARASFVKHGIVMYPEQVSGELFAPSVKADGTLSNMRLYEGSYIFHFVNIDKPSDKVSVPVVAHAMDNGDKAPGKAMTYGAKTAVLKLLWLETGENEESREETKERSKPKAKPLPDDRFKVALEKVKAGEFPSERLASDYALTEAQTKQLDAVVASC